MPDKIKLAIIGCGGIARNRHVTGLTLLKNAGFDRFELVAACDVNREQAELLAQHAREHQGANPTIYTDWQECIQKEKLDAVDICLPHGLHHTVGVACLDSKLDVIMEKPLAVTLRAGRRLCEAADRNKRVFAVAVPKRRMAQQRAAHWALTSGLVGKPRTFFTLATTYRPIVPNQQLRPAMVWRRDRAMGGGGMVMDSGFHYCDSLQYFFGEPDQVYAEARAFEGVEGMPKMREQIGPEREDTWTAILSFKNGVVGSWSYTTAAPGKNLQSSIIYASDGSIEDTANEHPYQPFHWFEMTMEAKLKDGTTYDTEQLSAAHKAAVSPAEWGRLFPYGVTEAFAIEIWDFMDAVLTGRKPEVDGWDALTSQAINEAVYESAVCGQAVKVADVAAGKYSAYQDDIDRHWGLI